MAENVRRRIAPVAAAGRVEETGGEFAIGGALTTIPTPGHTSGRCTVLAASRGAHLLLPGDAAHHPIPPRAARLGPAESARPRGKAARLAVGKDAIVTGGRFPILSPGRIREADGGCRREPP